MYVMNKLEFPKEIMIEVTNSCNCKCFFCGSNNSIRKKGFIEEALAERLIKEAYNYGARKISFHGMGEPFLSNKLAKYVSIAKKEGYTYIYLDTNGIVATPEKTIPVLDAGLDSLKFSIHAATAETHKRIVGVDGYEILIENLRAAREYIEKEKISCKLIAYQAISTLNCHEIDAFRALMQPLVDEVWSRPIHNGSGARPENKTYSTGAQETTMKELPCKELYQRIIITWEGKAIACSTDWTGTLVYGDAKQNDLLALWNSDELWAIRRKHENRNTLPSICSKCMTEI